MVREDSRMCRGFAPCTAIILLSFLSSRSPFPPIPRPHSNFSKTRTSFHPSPLSHTLTRSQSLFSSMPPTKQLVKTLANTASTSSRSTIARKSKSAPKIKDDSSDFYASSSEEDAVPSVVKGGKRRVEVGEEEGRKRVKKEERSEEEEGVGVGAPAQTLEQRSRNVGKKFSPGQGQDDYELSE